ncbi:MAG: hypothetical protein PHP44_10390 [Kiritimatiellae bacterium]|nr:hypothetical protein [Kiritimatiellia bacterium]
MPLLVLQDANAGLRLTLGEQDKRLYGVEDGLLAQAGAGDALQIQVTQVNVLQTENSKDVVVMLKALVENVRRSDQGREAGDVIYIRYRTRDGTGYEDESDPIIPDEGARLPAFLDYIGAENHYVLAAGAFSFLSSEEAEQRAGIQAETTPETLSRQAGITALDQPNTPMHEDLDLLDEAYWNAPVAE